MSGRDDLSTGEWLLILSRLEELGVMRVCLTGGEVFTRPDLARIIDGVIDSRMRFTILTNGTLIGPAEVEMLAGPRRRRIDAIQVSIDGPSARVHDAGRPRSFDGAVRAVLLMRDAGLPVDARMTISRHNLGCIEETARFILEDLGLPGFSTNEAFEMGSACSLGRLAGSECLEAMRSFERLSARYPGRIHGQAGPLARMKAYREMEEARRTGVPCSRWRMGVLSGCGCVFTKLSILHDGTMVPCHVLHSLGLGSALLDPIGEIWRSHPVLEALRGRETVEMSSIPGCADCTWTRWCNGGCPGLPVEQGRGLYEPSRADCYRTFLEETGGAR